MKGRISRRKFILTTVSVVLGLAIIARRRNSIDLEPLTSSKEWITELIKKDAAYWNTRNFEVKKNIYGVSTVGTYLIVNMELNDDF